MYRLSASSLADCRHGLSGSEAAPDREERFVLGGYVQVDDAYLGGERTGSKVGRGSEYRSLV
jgi:hypothetical protein